MWEILNSLWNTVSVVPRYLGTALNTAYDLVGALSSMGYNYSERMGSRTKDIKEAIKNATNTWPQRKRWIKRPWAYIAWTWSYMTWSVRAWLTSLRDGVGWILQALWNTFYNAWTATMRMWKKDPIGSFSFTKHQQETVEMKSYVMPKRFPAITIPAPAPTPTPTP